MVLLKTTLVALLAALTTATPIEKRSGKFLVHQLQATQVPEISKRDDLLDFEDTTVRYTTDLNIGSSKESVKVMIDTGSWRLNVPGPGAKCLRYALCPAGSVFHPDKSNTFHNLTIQYISTYGSGETSVTGFTVHDNLFFDNGDEIPQFEFEVANKTDFEMGWLGVRYSSEPDASYVVAAKRAGLVDHAGFSLYLGPDGQTGTFIVGGVDKAKYEGELAFYDTDYFFQGKSVTTGDGNVIPLTRQIGIDSGNPRLAFDQNIVDAIIEEVGADKNGNVPCVNIWTGNKNLTLDLGEITIDVPYSAIFTEISNNPGWCHGQLENTDKTGNEQYLGLPFVRQIYLTQDFDTKRLGFAPVKHTDESNIVDFWF